MLRSSWKSVQVCFRPRPTRWRRRFYVKMTSSRCHAHFTHLLRKKSRCFDCAENLHDCSLDIARHDDCVSFSKLWLHHLRGHCLTRQKLKILRSSWKSVQVCFWVRPTPWRRRFYVKMTSSRCHAHFTDLLREKSRCSDCSENLHDCNLDIGRHDDGVSFSKLWRHHPATPLKITTEIYWLLKLLNR